MTELQLDWKRFGQFHLNNVSILSLFLTSGFRGSGGFGFTQMQGGDSFRLQEGRNACFARSAVPRRQNTEVNFLRREILTDGVLGRQFLQL